MAMKESTKNVFNYLKAHAGEDLTANDVAEALGLTSNSVNGSYTRSIKAKKLGDREEVEIELPDGTHKKVKFLRLNDAGMAYDPDAEVEAKDAE